MKRREFITLLGGAAARGRSRRGRSSPARLYRIGVLHCGSTHQIRRLASILIDALKELGWTEGKNIAFEPRFADNNLDRLPELAAELVSLNVDVILAIGTLSTTRCEAGVRHHSDCDGKRRRSIRGVVSLSVSRGPEAT